MTIIQLDQRQYRVNEIHINAALRLDYRNVQTAISIARLHVMFLQ